MYAVEAKGWADAVDDNDDEWFRAVGKMRLRCAAPRCGENRLALASNGTRSGDMSLFIVHEVG